MRIKVDSVRYHRNGMSGAPFFCVAFRHRLEGERKERSFVAAVFDEPGVVAVIEPANPRKCWRGDHFEVPLRAACAEADRTGEAFKHEGTDN